jgi:hypothetical protein
MIYIALADAQTMGYFLLDKIRFVLKQASAPENGHR